MEVRRSEYSAGEGLSHVKISINGLDTTTYTADAGGYGLPVPTGLYTVTAKLPDGRIASKQFTIDGENVKVDFTLADFGINPVPKISLSADSTTIHQGQTSRLFWTSLHASQISLNQGIGFVPPVGAIDVSPMETTTYTLTATNAQATIEESITIVVLPPLPALTLSANPDTIWIGESTELIWTTEHTTSCFIDNDIGAVNLTGSITVSPTETTTYSLSADNQEGTSTVEFTVTVEKPASTMEVDTQNIVSGGSATLQWSSDFSDECHLEPSGETVALNGTLAVSPTETTEYTIICTKDGYSTSTTITVYVDNFNEVPTAGLSADALAIQKGSSTSLHWVSSNGKEFVLDNDIGDVGPSGSVTVVPEHTTTYKLTVIGPVGSITDQVTIKVLGDPEPQPKGSFGAYYNDKIPIDATVEKYDARRFSLVKGSIATSQNTPLAGVLVSVLDRPEFGTSETDANGAFVLAVDGGSTMTVSYAKEGYLSSQRQAYVPWNDIVTIPSVQMITEDIVATTVHFDGNPATVITHRATTVTDSSGSRAMTMVFQGDNKAWMVDENGVRVKELTSITTRATEYSTPKSMPAELPETTAYTYCVELAVDGVERIEFEKPVVTFNENFLGFEVGSAVPLGYYDRDKGTWIAVPNGLVVRLLDGDSDGIVDSLDGDGDGNPDDLDGDGDFADEVIGLSDSALYPPGATFWRAEVSHFTPWDYNWCTLRALQRLMQMISASLDGQKCPEGVKCSTGSSVSIESQIFNEDIAIPGTGLSLAYTSDRAKGFKNIINVPASGSEIIPQIKRIIVQVDVAGQILEETLPAEANQVAQLAWDGLDGFGNEVFHKVTAHVKVGYVYDSEYLDSALLRMSFAEFGTTTTSVPARDEVINWTRSDIIINLAEKDVDIAQGWSLSAHHKFDPSDPTTLHKGNGATVKNDTTIITTIAGNGEQGWAKDGADALETPMSSPTSVALNPAGELFIANQLNPTIVKIDRDGLVHIIAGGGVSDEDNIPATLAALNMPSDITFDSNGNLYLADSGSCKIRKIDTAGIITTVAGTGECESTGDGGSALLAGIMPNSIAVDNFGNMYFSEATSCVGGEVDPITGQCVGGTIVEGSYRVRKISTNGIVSTVVGTGEKFDWQEHGWNGDGGQANLAYLTNPTSVSVDQDGNLYLTDNVTIRKVTADGIITTVAGLTGQMGYEGDGGLAIDAKLTGVSGVTFDHSGNFYFSQYYGNGDVIRKVSSNGYISTAVGQGPPGMEGDQGAATKSQLMQPGRLALDAAGSLYIPDNGNKRVRKAFLPDYNGEETYFVEPSGIGHLISADGLHTNSYDLETGVSLLEFGYNSEDDLTTITDQFGNVVTIERLSDGTPFAINSPDGLRTELTVDGNNQLTHLSYPDGSSYVFEYDNNDGLLTAKNEPNGNRFEHFFDENGRVYKTNNLEGGLWEFSRTRENSGTVITSVTTPNTQHATERLSKSTGELEITSTSPSGEIVTSYTSSDGLDSETKSSCGPTVTTSSDLDHKYGYKTLKSSSVTTPAGLTLTSTVSKEYVDVDVDGLPEIVTSTVTLNGKSSTLVHDVQGSTYTSTSPENRIGTSSYDPETLQTITSSVSGLFATDYTYFADGKLDTVTTGDRQTAYSYDASGNLATVTDASNLVTKFTDYDDLGRVTRVEQADGTLLRYGYDNNGNMTLLTTPTPADNSFTYNGFNKRSSFLTPLGSTTSYSYNAERQLTTVILPSGKEIHNSYTDGLLVETVTDEWTNSYLYSCGNLLESVSRGSESISQGYDGNLLTSISQSGTINEDLIFAYDNDFNLTTFTYAGETESYGYDNDSLLTASGRFAITRNIGNGLPEMVADSNFELNRSFNNYGEVDSIAFNISGAEVFGYDTIRNKIGKITTKTERIEGAEQEYVYTYDDLGRLLTVTKESSLVEEYRYDNNGNRTYEMNSHRGIAGRSFSYSDEDHIITAGTITYSFDADDSLASRTDGSDTTEYFYSSTGELMSVTLPDSTVIEYVNDPQGRRIAKKVNGTITEKYLWSGLTTLLAVFDGSDNLLQRFEYADGRMPYAMTSGGSTYYLNYDQVGSLRLVADSSGTIVKRIDYDSFGNIISDSNSSFAIPFGFAGGLSDSDTGLIRFGFRDYLPELGKWTAKDPILFAGGDSNLFGYVHNDPVNFIDPLGLTSYGPFGSIASYSPTIASNFQAAEAGVESAINTVSNTISNGPNITSGEMQAAGYLIGGAGVTALGIMTSPEGAPLIGVGIPLLTEGVVRAGAESLGGDTANLPNWWVVLAEILEGLTNSNEDCVE